MSTQSRGRTGAPPLDPTPLAAPGRIDRYRILRVLGEGGMGVVYLAEQDEPVRREVALKVLRAGVNSEEVVARFASERQALALMEHPNITRVFDAGITPAGLPYFVMERVEGVPITEHAASRRLDTRARAGLFVQVCRAVQHAHQKGIIHRDLKPSNVLVTEAAGAPLCKVIDFGIAKATGPADIGARVTATGIAIGTPAYMSPEQFLGAGDDVDTRTDIYSLGVLLYELLAGSLPGTDGETPSWGALLRRAGGDLPSASAQFASLSPATRAQYAAERGTDPEALRRSLRGDLDAILTTALDPDRDRRYPTAAAFADDLERFLADQPIMARGAGRAYRAGKFVRRHRAGVALAAVLLVVLVATAIGATVQARRLAVARTTAQARQRQAEALIGFMLGDLTTRLRPIGRLDVLDDVGRKALAYFADVPLSSLSAEDLGRRAEALELLGSVRADQGRLPEAAALTRQSITASRELVSRDSADPRWQLQLAHSEFRAGSIAWQQGRLDEAVSHFSPFVTISDRLVARFPDSLDYRAQRAYAINNIGVATEARGDVAGALRSYTMARDILTALVARDTGQARLMALAAALNAGGEARRKLGDLPGALASHREELAVKARLAGADPANMEYRRLLAIAHVYLADVHLWRGATDSALAHVSEARLAYRALVARDPANVPWRLTLANSERRLGQVLLERGDVRGALAAFAAARADFGVLPAKVTANERAARESASLDAATAGALLLAGRTAEAIILARRATDAGEAALAMHPEDLERRKRTGDAWLTLGDARQAAGDATAAAEAWSRALSLASPDGAVAGETDFLTLRTGALLRLGRDAEAAPSIAGLLHRGVARPSVVKLLHAHGVHAAP